MVLEAMDGATGTRRTADLGLRLEEAEVNF